MCSGASVGQSLDIAASWNTECVCTLIKLRHQASNAVPIYMRNGTNQLCAAVGHDNPVLPTRARSAVEPEV